MRWVPRTTNGMNKREQTIRGKFAMLSSSYDFTEFMEKVKGHSFQEIIWMADQEATEAERCMHRSGCNGDEDKIVQYALCLKDFILYMRHGMLTRIIRRLDLDQFNAVRRRH